MKIKNITNKKRYIVVAAIVLLVAVGGALAYAYSVSNTQSLIKSDNSNQQTDTIDYDDPSPDEIKTGNDAKTETIEKDTASPEPATSLSVSITAAQQNGAVVQVRTLIDGVVSSGSCQLELSQGSKKVTKTVPIQALSSSSTCQGFDVSAGELSGGQWAINVSVTSGSISGSAQGSVNVTP